MADLAGVLARLDVVLEDRKSASEDSSYVARLFARGVDEILKKVGEEATELVIAAKDNDRQALIRETADLWFHTLVLLHHAACDSQAVLAELDRRFGVSGIAEKAARDRP